MIRREVHCSLCGESGHNRLTCNNQRLLDFEIICSTKCHTLEEHEFRDWLYETYNDNIDLLKTFVYKRMSINRNDVNDILFYINKITHYIYERYKNYYLSETDSDNESLPELISVDNEYNDVQLITLVHREYATFSNLNLYLATIEELLKIKLNQKKIAIETLVESLVNDTEQIECIICFETYNKSEFIKLGCQHEFCNDCIKKIIHCDNRSIPCCAYCRKEVTKMICRSNIVYDKMTEFIM